MTLIKPIGSPEKSSADEVKTYIFTFTQRSELRDYYITIRGTYTNTRERMHEIFGDHWAFQYNSPESAGVYLYNLKCLINL